MVLDYHSVVMSMRVEVSKELIFVVQAKENLVYIGVAYQLLQFMSDNNNNTVQCHTDLSTCCSGSQGIHRGDWYFPNGTRLPFSGDVSEARGAQRVELRRTMEGNVSGIYWCDIPTNAVHDDADISVRDTVYVGLYINGGNDGSIALTFHHYYYL